MTLKPRPFHASAWAAGLGAWVGGALLLRVFPRLELEFFARGAAQGASLFTGAPVCRIEKGWMLPFADVPVVVTEACSATGYLLIVAALVGWQLSRHGRPPLLAIAVGLGAAGPTTILVNSLRIVAVAHAHRWIIPRLPAAYDSVAHLFTGVAVFLPSLIVLNLLLQAYGSRLSPSRR